MSIAPFCEHRLLVYREQPIQDEYGDPMPNWALVPVPDGLNATAHRSWGGTLQDRGPGEIQAAARQWFLLPGFDIRERDAVQVVAGPETGRVYRVESVSAATMPLEVHHYEVMLTPAPASLLTQESDVS